MISSARGAAHCVTFVASYRSILPRATLYQKFVIGVTDATLLSILLFPAEVKHC